MHHSIELFHQPTLTLNLLTTTIIAPPSNASKWQMGFNSAFKGIMHNALNQCTVQTFAESEDTSCCVNIIFTPEDEHVNARNMSRIIV